MCLLPAAVFPSFISFSISLLLYIEVYVQGGYLIGKQFLRLLLLSLLFLLLSVLKISLTAVGRESNQCCLFFLNPPQNSLPLPPIISTEIIAKAVTPIHSYCMFCTALVVCGVDRFNCKQRKPQWVTCILFPFSFILNQ